MGRSTPYQAYKRHIRRYNEWVRETPEEAKKQKLESLPEIPLHGLRHSCATLLNYLKVNIIDISKILGHAKSSTTMDIYAHSFEEQLGEGWVAEETLAIAIYCALKYSDDFINGVVAAVNHDGDSDSTGAVTGNILGTALGFEAIPQKYLDKLELKDVILEIAEDLHHDCQITEYGPGDDLWESKYIRMSHSGKV